MGQVPPLCSFTTLEVWSRGGRNERIFEVNYVLIRYAQTNNSPPPPLCTVNTIHIDAVNKDVLGVPICIVHWLWTKPSKSLKFKEKQATNSRCKRLKWLHAALKKKKRSANVCASIPMPSSRSLNYHIGWLIRPLASCINTENIRW